MAELVELPAHEAVGLGQTDLAAPADDPDHRGDAAHVGAVVVEHGDDMSVLHARRQSGLLRQFPHGGRRDGFAGLDAATRHLPHALRRAAQQHPAERVGDDHRGTGNGLRLGPPLLLHAERAGRPAQHQHRQVLRVEPLDVLEPAGQRREFALVQRDVAPVLGGVLHDRRDDDEHPALAQPRRQSAQDTGPIANERDGQAQHDQVVPVLGEVGQVVMFDVQAQPTHPLHPNVFRAGPRERALGEVDAVDGVPEGGEVLGHLPGAAADVQRAPALRCRHVLDDQALLPVPEPPEVLPAVVVLGPVGPGDSHRSLLRETRGVRAARRGPQRAAGPRGRRRGRSRGGSFVDRAVGGKGPGQTAARRGDPLAAVRIDVEAVAAGAAGRLPPGRQIPQFLPDVARPPHGDVPAPVAHRGGSSPGALRRTYACGISTSRGSASSASRTGPCRSPCRASSSATIAARAAAGSTATGSVSAGRSAGPGVTGLVSRVVNAGPTLFARTGARRAPLRSPGRCRARRRPGGPSGPTTATPRTGRAPGRPGRRTRRGPGRRVHEADQVHELDVVRLDDQPDLLPGLPDQATDRALAFAVPGEGVPFVRTPGQVRVGGLADVGTGERHVITSGRRRRGGEARGGVDGRCGGAHCAGAGAAHAGADLGGGLREAGGDEEGGGGRPAGGARSRKAAG